MKRHRIIILPYKKEICVNTGTNLLKALRKFKIEVPGVCAGKGICGKCVVQIKNAGEKGKVFIDKLACQINVNCPLVICIPKNKNQKLKILKDAKIYSRFKRQPLVKRVNFASGRSLILDNDELLAIEKTDKKHIFGLAIDVGTTTICVSLCNLENGEEITSATIVNSQSAYGVDLISRLAFATKSKENQQVLSEKVIFSINKAIDECVQKSGVERRRIYSVIMVGNSVMQHLLFKIPVRSFITPPYNITHKGLCLAKAGVLKIAIHPNANVRFLPSIGGFVGSDVLSSILSLALFKSKEVNLCVDLGTNGEIILRTSEGFAVASTAAGSAFEGYSIKCGMVARSGAIEWIRIHKDKIQFQTIDHIQPLGICGSGIIDMVSGLLKEGIIDSSGRMRVKSFLIYEDKNIRIEFTDKDVREVQLAKAAVCAGIRLLMRRFKIKPEQIKKVFLAGALGNYLNAENAVRIGLFPPELKDKIEFAGNTAFLGAKLALLSGKELKKTMELVSKIKHISLAKDKCFTDEFTNALKFSNL